MSKKSRGLCWNFAEQDISTDTPLSSFRYTSPTRQRAAMERSSRHTSPDQSPEPLRSKNSGFLRTKKRGSKDNEKSDEEGEPDEQSGGSNSNQRPREELRDESSSENHTSDQTKTQSIGNPKISVEQAREWITDFYQTYNPDKLHTVEALLIQYKDEYGTLISRLKEKYNVPEESEEVEVTQTEEIGQAQVLAPVHHQWTVDQTRMWLIDFYKVHNPDKLDTIEDALAAFEGDYETLILKLKQKYNVNEDNSEVRDGSSKEQLNEKDTKEDICSAHDDKENLIDTFSKNQLDEKYNEHHQNNVQQSDNFYEDQTNELNTRSQIENVIGNEKDVSDISDEGLDDIKSNNHLNNHQKDGTGPSDTYHEENMDAKQIGTFREHQEEMGGGEANSQRRVSKSSSINSDNRQVDTSREQHEHMGDAAETNHRRRASQSSIRHIEQGQGADEKQRQLCTPGQDANEDAHSVDSLTMEEFWKMTSAQKSLSSEVEFLRKQAANKPPMKESLSHDVRLLSNLSADSLSDNEEVEMDSICASGVSDAEFHQSIPAHSHLQDNHQDLFSENLAGMQPSMASMITFQDLQADIEELQEALIVERGLRQKAEAEVNSLINALEKERAEHAGARSQLILLRQERQRMQKSMDAEDDDDLELDEVSKKRIRNLEEALLEKDRMINKITAQVMW
eukprot:CAMPEP_0117740632 /NCGR_PEP_ID=MMETSP0947-20121206/4456_1 /TAXON_ID=44440 /ORGANISM="Chattonella subsalsa, Strain CCMP2191" /LENGTH=678 /DNA_ID=CAMNT_0005556781 /DNA_START=158 /DNA_END=2191 /DNA_ORIENTATION=+